MRGRTRFLSTNGGISKTQNLAGFLIDDDFRIAISKGICKVNIFTDIDKAGKAGVEEGLAAGAKTLMGLIPYSIAAMKKVVANKMELFGSIGKA